MRVRTAVAALSLAAVGILAAAGIAHADDDWHVQVTRPAPLGTGDWSNTGSVDVSPDDSRGLCLSDLYC
ncbi:hypothetical protein [Embleya scabrispora]|uniref:hypothetical protein n=1 Tax=Embleya scabrispora TaxID=159449 RepID=UPI00037D7C35|nr:hypothetical protein [Embleya scabrispora]MYS82101.1 hypothetical protein [Streptomyces sp. SID5474]